MTSMAEHETNIEKQPDASFGVKDMERDAFYIGWMPSAPGKFAKHVRSVGIALFILMIIAASVFALQQKKFSTSNFEFGQLTEVKGIYQPFPVPSLKVLTSNDAMGN